MPVNVLCGQLKRWIQCNGVIQILRIPEGDDFRLFEAINFLQVKKCARIPYQEFQKKEIIGVNKKVCSSESFSFSDICNSCCKIKTRTNVF